MLNNRWNWMPLWSPPGEGAAGDGLTYADDAPKDDAADASADSAADGVADNAADDAAGDKAGDDAAGDDDAASDADAAKAARKAELDAMSPEDRAKAEADDAAAEAEEARLDAIPEDGKYELKMPEGVEVDTALMTELGPEFAALGLSNRDAQRLADKFIAAQTARMTAQAERWNETTQGWVDTAKKDPEIGGAKWDATAAAASGVVERFGTDGLREYLNASGAGNHPELIRLLAKVGAAIGEDDPIVPENPGGGKRDTVTAMYPNDPPKGK